MIVREAWSFSPVYQSLYSVLANLPLRGSRPDHRVSHDPLYACVDMSHSHPGHPKGAVCAVLGKFNRVNLTDYVEVQIIVMVHSEAMKEKTVLRVYSMCVLHRAN